MSATMTMPQQQTTTKLPKRPKMKCCHEPTRCTNGCYWMIDGKPYCRKHFDDFWTRSGTDVTQHRIARAGGVEWG
jgi:hypothetical protein